MTRALATPFQVSAAAHLPGAAGGPRTLLRLEGFAGSVAHRASALAEALADFAPARLEEGQGDWAAVRDAAAFAGRDGAVWRVSVKPTDGPPLARPPRPAPKSSTTGAAASLWVLAPETLDVRAAMAGIPGHATLVRASDAAKRRLGVFHPEPAGRRRPRRRPARALRPDGHPQSRPDAADECRRTSPPSNSPTPRRPRPTASCAPASTAASAPPPARPTRSSATSSTAPAAAST